MRNLVRPLAVVFGIALAAMGLADLGVGDKAPEIKVDSVVKGKAPDLSKGVHVVEFWATWCGPCKVSIPHLTEMAKKYEGKADFTGVSISEQGDDQLGQVKKFVTTMGPKMDYNVAWDGPSKTMAKTWMEEAKQNGIPTAFLVKDGEVLWIGHPMAGLDEAVGQAVAGTFDVEAAKKKFAEQQVAQAEQEKKQAAMAAITKPFTDAMQQGDLEGGLDALDKIEKDHPEMTDQVEQVRFSVLMRANDKRAYTVAKSLADNQLKGKAEALNELAWSIIDPASKVKNPDYATAVYIAQKAAEASEMKEPNILDTYGLALFKAGQRDKAIEIQTKAVTLAKASPNMEASQVKELEDRLAEFKKSA